MYSIPKKIQDILELQIETEALDDKKAILHTIIIPPETGTRKPSTFICAIDISGSMGEEATLKKGDEVDIFTRLDLVKHSIKTIIYMLNPDDNLCLIPFDDIPSVELPIQPMSKEGKNLANGVLDTIKPMYSTNIWGALRAAVEEVMKSPICKNTNNYILLFTDGEPNLNPPEGIMEALTKQLKGIPGYFEHFTIHTFGYGYSLDSSLLYDISVIGNGIYNYIEDSEKIGTTFVNFLSNSLSSSVSNTKLTVTPPKGVSLKSLGFEMVNNEITTGPIEFGQTRDFVHRFKLPADPNFEFSVTLEYGANRVTKKINGITLKQSKTTGIEWVRSMYCRYLSKEIKKRCGSSKKVKDYLSLIKKTITESPFSSEEQLKMLLCDLESTRESEGQVTKAFSNNEWLHRWGFHYLRSLLRAHQLQMCHNFRDPGVQGYGGECFRDLQDATDAAFCKIPAPVPSSRKIIPVKVIKDEEVTVKTVPKIAPVPASKPGSKQENKDSKAAKPPSPAPVYRPPSPKHYDVNNYSRYNSGCFDGEGEVNMINGKKKVKELVKGDEIICAEGKTAKIVAVIIAKVNSPIELVELRGVKLTKRHPIRINGEWRYPTSVKEGELQYCDVVYNLVLDTNHIVLINGLEVVTLGHGFKDNAVIDHKYFGSQKVIEDMKTFVGWDKGKVIIEEWKVKRDPITQRVQGLIIE